MIKTQRTLTIAYSSHRLETLGPAGTLMHKHEAVMLEEPPLPGFEKMLQGQLPIEEYLLATEFEYPQFARASSRLHRSLFNAGTVLIQTEPYMEALAEIHEFFAAGGGPEQLQPETLSRHVYEVERSWTGALVRFYKTSQQDRFEEVVRSVQEFARQDAARGRFRDSLRAQAVLHLLEPFASVYVEAGYIHFWLRRELQRKLPSGWNLHVVHLLEDVVRRLAGRRQVLGPGDLLTLLYTKCPGYIGERADLLAARSLIYSKIIGKEEEAGEDYPHLRDEFAACTLVRRLSFDRCRVLYSIIRGSGTKKAKAQVEQFLGRQTRESKTGKGAS